MALTYYIDGYNLLHQVPEYKSLAARDLEAARNAVVRAASLLLSSGADRVVVVFDGRGDKRPGKKTEPGPEGVEVLYSSDKESADTVIERFVYIHKDRSQVTVVTGDSTIRSFCMGLGALVLRPDHFLEALNTHNAEIRRQLQTSHQVKSIASVEDTISEDARRKLADLKRRLEKG